MVFRGRHHGGLSFNRYMYMYTCKRLCYGRETSALSDGNQEMGQTLEMTTQM